MVKRTVELIVVGTDYTAKTGGIAFALPGYFLALDRAGLAYTFVCTHSSKMAHGKWLLWLRSFGLIAGEVKRIRKAGKTPLIYSHVGGGAASFVRQFAVTAYSRLLGVESVMQLHGPEVNDYIKSRIKKWLFKIAIKPSSKLGVLTGWWKLQLDNAKVNKDSYVIPNPLPMDWEERACSPRRDNEVKDDIVVLCVARLEKGKGVDDLIRAMAVLSSRYKLVVAGIGSQLLALQQLRDDLELTEKVDFLGWVSGKEKQELFDSSDIFCLPSRYDSFGMGYLEAMSNGLPIVAFNWGPIADVVKDQRCGYLVDEYKPAALAAAIEKLSDVEKRKGVSVECKKWVLERFSSAAIGEDIVTMIGEKNEIG